MPRQTRRLPVGLTQLTYWTEGYAGPMTASEIKRLPERYEGVHENSRRRFLAHLNGPCGSSRCSVDPHVRQASQKRRAFLALQDYISYSREWERDRDAQRVFKSLSAAQQTSLTKRANRSYGRRGRRRWETLLETIARDQIFFERVLTLGPARLYEIAPACGIAESTGEKIYRAYRRQASLVFGHGLPVTPFVRALCQAYGVSLPPPGRLLATKPLIDIPEDLPRKARQRLWGLVLHWFAHAFTNLLRYRDGHQPLPWKPDCLQRCRKKRDKWSTVRPTTPPDLS